MVKIYKQLIQEYASKLKIHIDDSQLTLLSEYCESIESESVIKGFTKIQEPNNIANRHIGESLFLQKCINKYPQSAKSKLLDIGSGAGVPGIILGIMNTNCFVDLLDSNRKKSLYSASIIKKLKLHNINAISKRVEDLAKTKKELYEYAVAKALAPLSVVMEYAMPLLKINGMLFAPKGSESRKETNTVQNASKELACEIIDIIEFPDDLTKNNQAIIVIKKINKTPNRFPRKPGIAIKRPL